MSESQSYSFIRCSASSDEFKDIPHDDRDSVEVFFSFTRETSKNYLIPGKHCNAKEKSRALKLREQSDSDTYLFCHSLLRTLISKKLSIDPSDIPLQYNKSGKPAIEGDPLFFNISHTTDASAIAISLKGPVGIDIERIRIIKDFASIARKFFSKSECDFIFSSGEYELDKFFLIWTRKEALLKAVGSGIISDLPKVEVSKNVNFIDKALFNEFSDDIASSGDYFIFSWRIEDHLISVATPFSAEIQLRILDGKSAREYFDQFTV